MKKKTLNLQSRRIETPQNGVFYDVPHNGKRKKLTSIPTSYLKERIEYAIDQLRQRIDITTRKHLTNHKADALKRVEELRSEIMKAIEVNAKNGLRDQSELAGFCKDLDSAVDSFKSKHEETLHISQRFAEMFLGLEREALGELFELPSSRRKLRKKPKEEEMQKLTQSATEIIEENATSAQKNRLIKEKLKEANSDYIDLEERIISVKAMLDHLPATDVLNQFPSSVTRSIKNELEQMMALHQKFTDRQKLVGQIDGMTKDAFEKISHIEAGQLYFRALVHFKGRTDLSESVTQIDEQVTELSATKRNLEQLDSLTTELKEVQDQILELSNYRSLIQQIAKRLNPEDEALIHSIVQSVNPDGDEEVAVNGDKSLSEPENGPQTLRSRNEFKNFRWSNASKEEAANEARSRITALNPLIAHLAEAERWHDLRLVLDKMNTADLRACKLLSQSCTGSKDARFPKKSDLFEVCFPECYTNPEFTSLPGKIERSRQAKRFSWNKEGIGYPEIRAQVRERLFAAWPLLHELYNDQMWTELRYLLDKINGMTLSECRISLSAYAKENSPYSDYKEMLRDCFEEAFKG